MITKAVYGPYNPVNLRFATAKLWTDLYAVATDANALYFPADQAWDTDLATTQTNFAAKFVGFMDQLHPAAVARIPGNSIDNLARVNTTGVYDLPVASAAFTVGTFIGPAKDTGNALRNDLFVTVATAALAVARVCEDTNGANVTSVRCRLLSTLVPQAK